MGFSLKRMFGGRPTQANFNFPIGEVRKKIDELSSFAKSPIEGPSQAGQLTLDDIKRQQGVAQGGLAEQQQAGLSTALSNQAMFGGSSRGGSERLARASQQQGIQSQQGLFGEFGDIRSRALRSDLANEQSRRDRARDQALGRETGILGQRIAGELAKTQMQAQRDAERSGRMGRAFGALGGIFGGQRGASAGSFLGGGFA